MYKIDNSLWSGFICRLMRRIEAQDDRNGTGVYSCSQPGSEGIGF